MAETSENVAGMEKGIVEPDFSSVHTRNFPGILRELGVSLVVSTYQAGKLIILREDEGKLNTHFCQFASPMGVAFDAVKQRLALGTKREIWEFRNHPRVTAKLPPAGKFDAAFLPRHCQYTGDIRIHDVAWVGEELWAVNTRFSCLCVFDREHSFVPRWRPPFISALAAEDRCHLNGLAVTNRGPKLVTLLARTDVAGAWRQHKRDGGCLWDVEANAVVVEGMSMPHSPRFYEGRVWMLESGVGGVGTVDVAGGKYVEVARVPGFTRGLAFAGRYAFVGLSQIRESAIFGGIAIAELPAAERACGVWVIDIVTGKVAAFLRFEGVVQEIFGIEILPFGYPEMINEGGEVMDGSFVVPG